MLGAVSSAPAGRLTDQRRGSIVHVNRRGRLPGKCGLSRNHLIHSSQCRRNTVCEYTLQFLVDILPYQYRRKDTSNVYIKFGEFVGYILILGRSGGLIDDTFLLIIEEVIVNPQ
jgi:hypothetical protein